MSSGLLGGFFTLEWGLRIKYEDGTTKDKWLTEEQVSGLAGHPFADVIIRYVSAAEVVPMLESERE